MAYTGCELQICDREWGERWQWWRQAQESLTGHVMKTCPLILPSVHVNSWTSCPWSKANQGHHRSAWATFPHCTLTLTWQVLRFEVHIGNSYRQLSHIQANPVYPATSPPSTCINSCQPIARAVGKNSMMQPGSKLHEPAHFILSNLLWRTPSNCRKCWVFWRCPIIWNMSWRPAPRNGWNRSISWTLILDIWQI